VQSTTSLHEETFTATFRTGVIDLIGIHKYIISITRDRVNCWNM